MIYSHSPHNLLLSKIIQNYKDISRNKQKKSSSSTSRLSYWNTQWTRSHHQVVPIITLRNSISKIFFRPLFRQSTISMQRSRPILGLPRRNQPLPLYRLWPLKPNPTSPLSRLSLPASPQPLQLSRTRFYAPRLALPMRSSFSVEKPSLFPIAFPTPAIFNQPSLNLYLKMSTTQTRRNPTIRQSAVASSRSVESSNRLCPRP